MLPFPFPFSDDEDEEEPGSGAVVEVGAAGLVGEGCGDDVGSTLVGLREDEDEVGGVEEGVGVVLGGSVDEAGAGDETRNKEWSAFVQENRYIEDQI